jgi:flavin-dependent dehydrogenase
MIPPVTGNGMSMAFESAEIAITPVAAYYRGDLSWRETMETIATACDTAFGQRLKWAGVLQAMMFSPLSRSSLGGMALRSDWLWRWMFWATR